MINEMKYQITENKENLFFREKNAHLSVVTLNLFLDRIFTLNFTINSNKIIIETIKLLARVESFLPCSIYNHR